MSQLKQTRYITSFGYFTIMILCSCAQQQSKGGLQIKNGSAHQDNQTAGVFIENGINRGVNYADSLGNTFSLRYIPISVSNKSPFPVQFKLEFSNEYVYTMDSVSESFQIIPLPKEWAMDGAGVTDSMVNELPESISDPTVATTLDPGEKFILAVGTLYPRPPKISGILPNELFVYIEPGVFPDCYWGTNDDQSSFRKKVVGLKLNFSDHCMIIPCGQMTNPDI